MKVKTVLITLLVEPEIREKLADIAGQDMCSMAAVIRLLVSKEWAKRQTIIIPTPTPEA